MVCHCGSAGSFDYRDLFPEHNRIYLRGCSSMEEQQVANLQTTDRYRSPAPIRHGSSKVERLIEAQRVGGASPSRGAIS